MSNHSFYVDHKYTVWAREYYTIEANSEEEAKQKAKDEFLNPGNLTSYDFETMLDTMESIGIEENKGHATSELFFNGALLLDNRPVEVLRDETLNKILNEK